MALGLVGTGEDRFLKLDGNIHQHIHQHHSGNPPIDPPTQFWLKFLHFNQSIFSNYSKNEIWESANIISITFLENVNSFNDSEWIEMTKFANETFVEENDELKEKSAGAGLTDND